MIGISPILGSSLILQKILLCFITFSRYAIYIFIHYIYNEIDFMDMNNKIAMLASAPILRLILIISITVQ